MSNKVLTQEEKVDLSDLIHHGGFKPLKKLLKSFVVDRENSLIRYDLFNGVDKLVELKSELEGAKKVFAAFTLYTQNLKKP